MLLKVGGGKSGDGVSKGAQQPPHKLLQYMLAHKTLGTFVFSSHCLSDMSFSLLSFYSSQWGESECGIDMNGESFFS